MKNIILHLEKCIWLLKECGYSDKAKWFETEISKLKSSNPTTIKNSLNDINSILTGMGSFSDLPLIPSESSSLNANQARELQWNLIDELGKKISTELEE